MAAEEKWYFTKEQLANTPSRRCGTEADKELSNRQQAANFIQDMGQRLQVTQLCINTAIVYMHRFYVYHSFTHFHRNAIATAALFLAAKVEEQPRKLEHVIKVAHVCLQRQPQTLDTKSDSYLEQAQDLVFNENVLLQTLSFDVAIDHPHTHVVRCCHMVKASKDLAQTSYFMASNSLHLTTMCLQYKPTVVACFCIHLACKWSNWEIPQSNEGKDWFVYVDPTVTFEQLELLTTEFLQIFDKCPTKLKRKIMSITATQNAIMPSQGSQGSQLFDNEPRKIAESAHSRNLLLPSTDDATGAGSRKVASGSSGQPPTKVVRQSFDQYKEKRDKERQEREHKLAAAPAASAASSASGSSKEHPPRDGHHHKPHPSKPHTSQTVLPSTPTAPNAKMAPPAYYPRPTPPNTAPRRDQPAPKPPSFSIFSPPPGDDTAPGKVNHIANELEANRHHSDKYSNLVKDSRHSEAGKRPHGKDIAKPLTAEETQRMFGVKPNHKEVAAEKRTTPERHDALKRPAFGQPGQLNPTAHLKPLRTPSPVKSAPPQSSSSSHHVKPHHRPAPVTGRPSGHQQAHPSSVPNHPSNHPANPTNHATRQPPAVARSLVAGGTRTPTAPVPQHRSTPTATPPPPHRSGVPNAAAKPGDKQSPGASKPMPNVGPTTPMVGLIRPKSPRQLMPGGGAKVESRPRSPRVPPLPQAALGNSAMPGMHSTHPVSNSTHLGPNSTHLGSNSVHLASNSGHLGSNSGHLISNSGNLASNSMNFALNSGHLTSNSGHIASNSGHITSNAGHIASNSGHLTSNSGHLTSNSGHLGSNSGHLGSSQAHLSANPMQHGRDSRNGGAHPAERRDNTVRPTMDASRVAGEDPLLNAEFLNASNVTPTKVRPTTTTPGSGGSSSSSHRSSGSKPSSRHATPVSSRKPSDFVMTPLAPLSPDYNSKHPPLTPGGPSNNGKNRNRTTSSSSEPELVPYIMKIEDIAGCENVLDSQEGFKLSDKSRLHESVKPLRPKEEPKLLSPIRSRVKTEPELLSPIRSRLKEEPVSPAKAARPREEAPSPVKLPRIKEEFSPTKRIKEEPFVRAHLPSSTARPPEMSRTATEITFPEPPTYAAATEPELANGVTRESFIDVVNDSEPDFIKNMIEPSRLVVMPTALTLESPVKSEHRHKSEKKKKKEKHKHKDRDKDKPSREERKKEKKKHKEKTKEREAAAAAAPLPATPGIKITIPKEKILATTIDSSPAGLKIKIHKDRLKESGSPFGGSPVSTPVAGGGLKLKISKDIIETYTTPMATKESRKRQSSRPTDDPRPAKAPRAEVRKPTQNGVPRPSLPPHGKAEYASGAATGSHSAKKPPP